MIKLYDFIESIGYNNDLVITKLSPILYRDRKIVEGSVQKIQKLMNNDADVKRRFKNLEVVQFYIEPATYINELTTIEIFVQDKETRLARQKEIKELKRG